MAMFFAKLSGGEPVQFAELSSEIVGICKADFIAYLRNGSRAGQEQFLCALQAHVE